MMDFLGFDFTWEEAKSAGFGSFFGPTQCVANGGFAIYWTNNMRAMGIDVPSNFLKGVVEFKALLVGAAWAVKKYGAWTPVGMILKTVPLREIDATDNAAKYFLELVPFAAGLSASYVLGCIAGSAFQAWANMAGCPSKEISYNAGVKAILKNDPVAALAILNNPEIIGALSRIGLRA